MATTTRPELSLRSGFRSAFGFACIAAFAALSALSLACSGNASLGDGVHGDGGKGSGGAIIDNAGSGGHAGSCNIPECLRAVECVASCDGPILTSGCCPCADGTFDRVVQCHGGTGGAAAPTGTGGVVVSTGTGGASGTGGVIVSTGTGGVIVSTGTGGDCGTMTCFRAIECVATCGGPVLSSGCCPCAAGTFDRAVSCGTGGAGGSTVDPRALNQPCGTNDACPAGLTAVHYFGIAGPTGPQLCSCSIRCTPATSPSPCPSGTACDYIADGPNNVCVLR